VVDFGVKYIDEEHAFHLIAVLQQKYTIAINWPSDKYDGSHLFWDYKNQVVHIIMPNNVTKALQ
jgi:hypothetical protein